MNLIQTRYIGRKPTLTKPILIEGLPGIGNVGKVAVDFMIDELKAVKLFELFSYTFPHSVFVNENNLVELPTIEIYYKKMKKGNDLLLLAGDVQPIDEVSCYEFSEKVLDIMEEFKGAEIVTLGGIGLQSVPKKPKVYCTGNSADIVTNYKKGTELNEKIYGVVGPIVGVSGLLLGLAEKRNIPAIAFLGLKQTDIDRYKQAFSNLGYRVKVGEPRLILSPLDLGNIYSLTVYSKSLGVENDKM